MTKRLAAAGLLLCLTSTAGLADFRRTVLVDHAKLGACTYSTLERIYPSQVRYVDLRAASTIKLTLEDTAVGLFSSASTRLMDMEIRQVGKAAEVTITGFPTVWGADHYAERTWKEIQGCLPPGP
jgi:hypothetical protein